MSSICQYMNLQLMSLSNQTNHQDPEDLFRGLRDLNPLVSAIQANSLSIFELQLQVFQMVGKVGFEPTIFGSQNRRIKPDSPTFREISKTRLAFND